MTIPHVADPVTLTTIDIDPDLPERIAVHTDFRLKELVKVVPGARWDSTHRRWTVPLTWPSCLALRAQFGSRLEIAPALRAWASEVGGLKKWLRELRTSLDGVDLTMIPVPGLFGYQGVGARLIARAGQYLLFDSTGTGKSRTALAGVVELIAEYSVDEVFPMLIVAPKSMLQTWARTEIPAVFPFMDDVSVVEGTKAKMTTAMEPGHRIYIMSYDTLRRNSRHAGFGGITLAADEKKDGLIQALGIKTIIADEVHRAKNAAAKQTRALWFVAHQASFRIGLTGTPIQDTPEDLWSLLHFVSPEEYPTKTSYIERFCKVDYNPWGGREIRGLNFRTEEELRANMEARWRRISKEVALPFLPPKVYEIRWVEMPPALRRAYRSMVDDLTAEMLDGTRLDANSVLTRALRLTQLANCSGTVETDADGEEIFRMALPSPKLSQFMDDVKDGDYDGSSVVVYSDSRQLIELLSGLMDKAGYEHTMIHGDVTGPDRQNAIDRFQNGEVKFILLTRAGGEGITLTAANVMVRLMRSWSYIAHTQAEDRVHRIGSEIHDSVTYVDYVVQDTVEEGQLARLSGKGARAEEVLRDEDLLEMLKSK